MSILDQDTFNRINQATFGTASNGSPWSYAGASGSESISSTEGLFSTAAGDSFAILGSGTAGTVNNTVRCATDSTGNFIGVMARYSNSGGVTCYRAGLYNGTIQVDKYIAGSRSSVGNISFSYTTGTFYWISFVCVGSALSVYAWADGSSKPGSPQWTGSDGSIVSGQYGLSTFLFSGNTYVDHLTVTDNQASATPLTTEARVQFKVRAVQQTQTRASFLLRRGATTNARAKFITRALNVVQARVKFLIPLRPIAVPFSASFSVVQKTTTSFSVTQKIVASFRSPSMPQPNSTIQTSATVKDNTGALLSNLSSVSVTLTFPDGSTTSLVGLGNGVVNAGSGVYTILYQTKTPGLVREEWKVVASDGTTTADFINIVPVSY